MESSATRKPKCGCGSRHLSQYIEGQGYVWTTVSGIQHGCRVLAAMETANELASAKGIARRAAEYRQEAEARLAWAAQQPEGPRRDRHIRVAHENFALAYELES